MIGSQVFDEKVTPTTDILANQCTTHRSPLIR